MIRFRIGTGSILPGFFLILAGSIGLPAQELPPGRARTEIVVQGEWFYFSGGSGLSSDEVIPGYVFTRYKSIYPWGGGVFLRRTGASAPVGFSIGIRYAPMSLTLQEGRTVFGTLKVEPLMADLRIDFGFDPGGLAPAPNGNGIRAFLGGGAGMAGTSFSIGPFLRDLEASTGIGYSVATKSAFILEGDAGIMILLHPITLTVFGGYIHIPGGVKSAWTASGPGGSLRIEDLNSFTVSAVKIGVSVGLTLFRLN